MQNNYQKRTSKSFYKNMKSWMVILGLTGFPILSNEASKWKWATDINNMTMDFLTCDGKDLTIHARLGIARTTNSFLGKHKLSLFKILAQDFLEFKDIGHMKLLNHLKYVLDNKETTNKEDRQELLKSLNEKSLLQDLDKELLNSAIIDLNKKNLFVVREEIEKEARLITEFLVFVSCSRLQEDGIRSSLEAAIKLIKDSEDKGLPPILSLAKALSIYKDFFI